MKRTTISNIIAEIENKRNSEMGEMNTDRLCCDVIPWLKELKAFENEVDNVADVVKNHTFSFSTSKTNCNISDQIDYFVRESDKDCEIVFAVVLADNVTTDYVSVKLKSYAEWFYLKSASQNVKLSDNLVVFMNMFDKFKRVIDITTHKIVGCFSTSSKAEILANLQG